MANIVLSVKLIFKSDICSLFMYVPNPTCHSVRSCIKIRPVESSKIDPLSNATYEELYRKQ